MNHPEITGLILAGGQSRRFGSDKAQHEVDGATMIQRVYAVMQQVTTRVLVSVADPSYKSNVDAQHVIDSFPQAGPLSGLLAGLEEASTNWILACAVDMPFINTDALELLIEETKDPTEIDVIVSTDGDRLQPFPGCYRASLSEELRVHLEKNSKSVLKFVAAQRVVTVPLMSSVLQNINTQWDLGNCD